MSKKIGEQSLLKYEKLYNWGRTLITSGVIQNEDKFPSENILQKKFGYSRQTVRTALNQLEAEGLIKRVKGSGTYVSYEGNLRNGERPRIGLILSYFSDYLFPRVYDGIDSVMKEAGYDIDVAVTKNRLNDEAIYLEGLSDYGVKFDDDWIRWYSTKDMEEKLSKKGLLRMYRRTKDCTAMIVYNDEVAGYYMEFLEERGLHVPEDVSLVSFDDEELQQDARVKVLSVVHPKYNLGRITGKNLLRMMDDPDWQNKNYSYRFPVSINDGNSVKDIR